MKQTANVEKTSSRNQINVSKKSDYSNLIIFTIARLIKPFLLLSLICHGLVLLIPLPNQEKIELKSQDTLIEEQVKLTLIPPPPTNFLPPSPESEIVEKIPIKTPQVTPAPDPQIINPSPPFPEPETIPQEPEELAIELLEESEPTIPEPEPPEEENEIILPTSPFALVNFPRFQDAESGCYGSNSCHQISGVQGVRNLSKSLQLYFEQNGYEVIPEDDYRDTGVEILALVKNAETQYLSILDTGEVGKAIYVLAPTPITNLSKLEKLQQARLDITNWLESFPNSQFIVEPNYLQQPEFFFIGNQIRNELGTKPLLFPDSPPDFVLNSVLKNQLENNGFEFTNLDNYGGGTMYELKQNSLIIGYFSLVTTKINLAPEEQGTVMFFWQIKPAI